MLHRPAFLVVVSSLLLISRSVLGANEVRISSASEFSTFVINVNKGSTYSGTTVYIDSDLSLSSINPIGDSSNYFRGIFDGQGHIISNLKVSSSSVYTGLFGYSEGLSIRNLVLDSSCSIKNTHVGTDRCYTGGFIGYCSGQCNIENNVNMASVAFNGDTTVWPFIGYTIYLGGIAGYLQVSDKSNNYINNCANYGTVTHSGKSGYSHIGGIIGFYKGLKSYYNYLYNSFNYGSIAHSKTTKYDLNIGGITGYNYYTYIKNCLSSGKISSSKKK